MTWLIPVATVFAALVGLAAALSAQWVGSSIAAVYAERREIRERHQAARAQMARWHASLTGGQYKHLPNDFVTKQITAERNAAEEKAFYERYLQATFDTKATLGSFTSSNTGLRLELTRPASHQPTAQEIEDLRAAITEEERRALNRTRRWWLPDPRFAVEVPVQLPETVNPGTPEQHSVDPVPSVRAAHPVRETRTWSQAKRWVRDLRHDLGGNGASLVVARSATAARHERELNGKRRLIAPWQRRLRLCVLPGGIIGASLIAGALAALAGVTTYRALLIGGGVLLLAVAWLLVYTMRSQTISDEWGARIVLAPGSGVFWQRDRRTVELIGWSRAFSDDVRYQETSREKAHQLAATVLRWADANRVHLIAAGTSASLRDRYTAVGFTQARSRSHQARWLTRLATWTVGGRPADLLVRPPNAGPTHARDQQLEVQLMTAETPSSPPELSSEGDTDGHAVSQAGP